MPNKRYATITDGAGKQLYKGEDRRSYNQDYPKCALGIPIYEWIKALVLYGSLLGGFVTVIVYQKQMMEDNKVFHQFIVNNDNWNSTLFHVRFSLGQPVDGSFKPSS